MNPAEWLLRTSLASPRRPAIFSGDRQVATYGEFYEWASGLAARLRSDGIEPGDRVAVFAKNCPEYLIALYAILHVGAVAVPINAKLHARETAWIIDDSGARLCFSTPGLREDLAGVVPAETCRVVDLEGISDCRTGGGGKPHETSQGDTIWQFYTSGTTGRPKGVMLTSQNLALMSLCYLSDVDDVSSSDASLYAAPMSHGAGVYNFIHVMRGASHVVPESGGFEPQEIFDLAEKIGNLSFFAAPTMVKRLVDEARRGGKFDGIKTIVYGGGPMYLADIIEAVDVMGPRFVQIYGQGECPMAITSLRRDEVADRTSENWQSRLASVGRAQSAVRIRIAREDGEDAAPGEVGEVIVQGGIVMDGYWNNPEGTNSTLRDGWLWTGDMGVLDEDGYLTLHDRSKDVIISGGTNIYPREVEEALLGHADVKEASVVGKPDPEWGEEVVAFVVLREGSEASEEDLDEHCLQSIARFKRPKRYFFLEQLPKNNYGKVLKTELRESLPQ